MKKVIKAANQIETFLKYHDDEDNYAHNKAGFDKMYEILDKYDNSNGNDPVVVAFKKASPEDKQRMIALITPPLKYNTREGARKMYYDALNADIENASSEYCEGVVDAIECLFNSGWLDETRFRIDL